MMHSSKSLSSASAFNPIQFSVLDYLIDDNKVVVCIERVKRMYADDFMIDGEGDHTTFTSPTSIIYTHYKNSRYNNW